jgi:hypothetical protein
MFENNGGGGSKWGFVLPFSLVFFFPIKNSYKQAGLELCLSVEEMAFECLSLQPLPLLPSAGITGEHDHIQSRE